MKHLVEPIAGTLLDGEITGAIIRLFLRVYDRLGFGYLESVYCEALAYELSRAGVPFAREAGIDVWYEGHRVGRFRADFVVADRVIVEAKACEVVNQAHRRQLLNDLRGSNLEVGLLLHFGPKPRFHRLIYTNDHKPSVRDPS